MTTDFSYAGTNLGQLQGSKAQNQLPVFKVGDFGAQPNDGKDDIDAIQRAVDAAAEKGGGMVLFEKGRYDFDVETRHRYVRITSNNIHLLGKGDNHGETLLYDYTASEHPDKKKPWLSGTWPGFFVIEPKEHNVEEEGKLSLVSKVGPAKRGSFELILNQPAQVKPNQWYVLTLHNPADTSLMLSLAKPLKKLGTRVADTSNKVYYVVKVLTVNGNKAKLESPLLNDLDPKWSPALYSLSGGPIENVSIIGMRFSTAWKGPFVHHLDGIHDNGWDAIKLYHVVNSNFLGLTFDQVSTAIGCSYSAHCTFRLLRITGEQGHNGFLLGKGATRNLMVHVDAGKQMHGLGLNGHAAGNVFLYCKISDGGGLDCHGGVAHYNLFDNLDGGLLRGGGGPGAIPPHHGNGLVCWRWVMTPTNPYNFRPAHSWPNMGDYPGLIAYQCRMANGWPLQFNNPKLSKAPWFFDFSAEKGPASLYEAQYQRRTKRSWGTEE